MYSSSSSLQTFKTWHWKLQWGLVFLSGAQGMKVGTHEASADRALVWIWSFHQKTFFQFFWWQQKDWKYKSLVSRTQDFSGLRKKSAYARATEEASIFLSKFEQVQERFQKEVLWTSVYTSQMTPPATYTYSPFSVFLFSFLSSFSRKIFKKSFTDLFLPRHWTGWMVSNPTILCTQSASCSGVFTVL